MKLLRNSRKIIIAGPCSAENWEQILDTSTQIAQIPEVSILRAGVWKPRTKPGGFEGIGEIALQWLQKIQSQTGKPVATEIATPQHIEQALKHNIKVLWIGARTTVNPFMVQEIAETLRGEKTVSIMLKNPMHPDTALWMGAVERIRAVGIEDIALIHRGFSVIGGHKYRNQPMWNIALEAKRIMPEIPLICDPSHIAGDSTLIEEVAQNALNLNYDGLMVETHNSPQTALSDSEQQITPLQLKNIINKLCWRTQTHNTTDFQQELANLRQQIDSHDTELFELMSRRMKISQKIGQLKAQNNVAILQNQRWNKILEHFTLMAEELELSENFVTELLGVIHTESIEQQNKIFKAK